MHGFRKKLFPHRYSFNDTGRFVQFPLLSRCTKYWGYKNMGQWGYPINHMIQLLYCCFKWMWTQNLYEENIFYCHRYLVTFCFGKIYINTMESGVLFHLVPTKSLPIPVGYLTITENSCLEGETASYLILTLILK